MHYSASSRVAALPSGPYLWGCQFAIIPLIVYPTLMVLRVASLPPTAAVAFNARATTSRRSLACDPDRRSQLLGSTLRRPFFYQ